MGQTPCCDKGEVDSAVSVESVQHCNGVHIEATVKARSFRLPLLPLWHRVPLLALTLLTDSPVCRVAGEKRGCNLSCSKYNLVCIHVYPSTGITSIVCMYILYWLMDVYPSIMELPSTSTNFGRVAFSLIIGAPCSHQKKELNLLTVSPTFVRHDVAWNGHDLGRTGFQHKPI